MFIQSCPDAVDVPTAVEPDLSKIDLEHLLRDLPKYKPWLSSVAWEAWEEFRTTTDNLGEVWSSPWGLPKLVSNAIIAGRARKESTTAPVSDETRAILSKETAVPAKVYI